MQNLGNEFSESPRDFDPRKAQVQRNQRVKNNKRSNSHHNAAYVLQEQERQVHNFTGLEAVANLSNILPEFLETGNENFDRYVDSHINDGVVIQQEISTNGSQEQNLKGRNVKRNLKINSFEHSGVLEQDQALSNVNSMGVSGFLDITGLQIDGNDSVFSKEKSKKGSRQKKYKQTSKGNITSKANAKKSFLLPQPEIFNSRGRSTKSRVGFPQSTKGRAQNTIGFTFSNQNLNVGVKNLPDFCNLSNMNSSKKLIGRSNNNRAMVLNRSLKPQEIGQLGRIPQSTKSSKP